MSYLMPAGKLSLALPLPFFSSFIFFLFYSIKSENLLRTFLKDILKASKGLLHKASLLFKSPKQLNFKMHSFLNRGVSNKKKKGQKIYLKTDCRD